MRQPFVRTLLAWTWHLCLAVPDVDPPKPPIHACKVKLCETLPRARRGYWLNLASAVGAVDFMQIFVEYNDDFFLAFVRISKINL